MELTVDKLPLYEYRELWAEEGGPANADSAEWSYGKWCYRLYRHTV